MEKKLLLTSLLSFSFPATIGKSVGITVRHSNIPFHLSELQPENRIPEVEIINRLEGF